MIVVDDGSEYCETEGRKAKKKGEIRTSNKQPARINKVIMEEDDEKFRK